jgi:MFS family permease
VRDGLAYLRRANNIRFALTVDLVAMALAQPRVLYPALGAVTLGGGVTTVGVLSAAFAAGAMLSALFSGWTGSVRRQGFAILVVSYIYAASIAAAGVVLLLALLWPVDGTHIVAIVALAAVLAVAGAADGVSAIFRGAILQAAVPDELRGRVQSIFSIIVTGGPRVGDVVTGAVASMLVIWSPLVAGGVAMLLVIWLLARRVPTFAHYDRDNPAP